MRVLRIHSQSVDACSLLSVLTNIPSLQRRAFYRCLLSLLAAHNSVELIVPALAALTRSVAGDPLEAKILDTNNTTQTAALVFAKLTDASGARYVSACSCVGMCAWVCICAFDKRNGHQCVSGQICHCHCLSNVLHNVSHSITLVDSCLLGFKLWSDVRA